MSNTRVIIASRLTTICSLSRTLGKTFICLENLFRRECFWSQTTDKISLIILSLSNSFRTIDIHCLVLDQYVSIILREEVTKHMLTVVLFVNVYFSYFHRLIIPHYGCIVKFFTSLYHLDTLCCSFSLQSSTFSVNMIVGSFSGTITIFRSLTFSPVISS